MREECRKRLVERIILAAKLMDTAMDFAQVGNESAQTPSVELVEQRRVEVLDRDECICMNNIQFATLEVMPQIANYSTSKYMYILVPRTTRLVWAWCLSLGTANRIAVYEQYL